MERVEKNRGQFSRSLVLVLYSYFLLIGIFSLISDFITETPTYVPYLRILAGSVGLVSTQLDDRYFVPLGYLIGAISIGIGLISFIIGIFTTPTFGPDQQFRFLLFGGILVGTLLSYRIQTE